MERKSERERARQREGKREKVASKYIHGELQGRERMRKIDFVKERASARERKREREINGERK